MILCCGEALIDMLPDLTGSGQGCFVPHAGGAVFNTAIALGRLGAPTGFFSGVSTDMLGEILTEALTRSNVSTGALVRSSRPTTVAFVKLVDGQATYAFYDENTAGLMLAADDLPTVGPEVSALFFGGISLVRDPAAATYEALQARECAARVTMIDPNIRPGFVTGREAGYRARLGRMLARADIVKLSMEDASWLHGDKTAQAHAEEILALGPKLLLLSDGAEGAWAFTPDHHAFSPARRVKVADTVGAGDTFNAGVLASLARNGSLTKARIASLGPDDLSQALTLGIAAASVTVSRSGANPPWAAELVE